MRLFLSLAITPAMRCELIRSLSLNFIENRALFALELPRMDIPPRRPVPAPLVRDIHQESLDPDLAAFLQSQPEIRDLSLPGIPSGVSDPFTLPLSALPHLETFRSVRVDPDTLGEVIATRPLEDISLSLFSEHGYRAYSKFVPRPLPPSDAWKSSSLTRRHRTSSSHSSPHTCLTSGHYTSSPSCRNTISYVYSRLSFSTIPMDTPVLSAEIRACYWGPRCCLKRYLACGFSRLWLVGCRVMNSLTRRRLRSVRRVRARR